MVFIQMYVQTLGAGTFDEIFGPGNTPSWALPTDVIKYQKDQLITNEQGFNLQNVVSKTSFPPSIVSKHCLHFVTLMIHRLSGHS